MSTSHESNFEIRIRPNQSWLGVDLRALWEFRDLLVLLVRRDFVARYQQTALGSAWAVVQPLVMTVVFTLVFGKFAGISTDGLPPMLFYLGGLLAWNYHAQAFQLTAATFSANSQLFGKVYFPRLIVPLAGICSSFIALLIQVGMFAVFWVYYKFFTPAGAHFSVSVWIWLFPLVLLQVAAVSLGAGLFVAAGTAKYRDLQHALPLLVQIWLYLTPIIYPLSKVPARWQWAVALNPLSAPVEMMRFLLLGQGEVDAATYLFSALAAVALLLGGVLIFQRTERTFIDTI
ncbi:MAG: ABC transporter permease [Chthoniobacterales bacterium]